MEPIAIIGLSCRFPGAHDPTAFWQLLRNGIDAISQVPLNRWNPAEFPKQKDYTLWGGFLKQVDQFDANFFGISPREAKYVDPQQRLLLEVAYEALENAGQAPDQLAGSRTGLFIGISNVDYTRLSLNHPDAPNAYLGTGNAASVAASRLAYILDLRGPSLALDTACSSSLVAVHLACQSLHSGECDMVLSGGVNLMLAPDLTLIFAEAQMLSPDGRCKTFDARANGYVRGEGCGVIVLKRLSDARKDNDTILAIIRGSAVNQDGHSNGITAPNGLAQEAVINQALNQAGVAPAQISYIEAHGTGTPLGDPIEVIALGKILARGRPPGSYCALGSVKTNIGHLEAAAGIAGLIKVVLSLRHKELPPSLHFQQPNPHIPFEELPIRIQQNLEPWLNDSVPAIAGVSSFGFSGTNAHIILEEAPQLAVLPQLDPRLDHLLLLSASNSAALQDLAYAYQEYLQGNGASIPLTDICYTANLRRAHHKERLGLVFHSREELVERLSAFREGESRVGLCSGSKLKRAPKLVFVFPGQGSQWWAMGRQLWEQEPVFQETIKRCDTLFAKWFHWSLIVELTASECQSRLNETVVAQPAIFAVQVALAALWNFWGVRPNAVVGHSLGEVAAAYIAGVLSLQDAVRIVACRARLMQEATGKGRMTAVAVSAAEAQEAITGYEERLAIAAINAHTSVVIAGEPEALDVVVGLFERQGKDCRSLRVNYSFHCPQMEPFQVQLVSQLEGLVPQPAVLPIFSTVTGELQEGTLFNNHYWGRNIRDLVNFAKAMEQLVNAQYEIFLEVAPHPVLTGSIAECLTSHGREGTILPSLRRQEAERATMLSSLGKLYTLGYPVNLKKLYAQESRVVSLPSYPWQREHYWLEPTPDLRMRSVNPGEMRHLLLGLRIHTPLQDILFESHFSTQTLPFLADHILHEVVVVPAACHIAMVLTAGAVLWGSGLHKVEDVLIYEALTLAERSARTVQLVLKSNEENQASFQIFSCEQMQTGQEERFWKLHATGIITTGYKEEQSPPNPSFLSAIRMRCSEEVPVDTYYEKVRAVGLNLGPAFRGIRKLWRRDGEALGQVWLDDELAVEAAAYPVHPALLDACFQVVGSSMPSAGIHAISSDVYIPIHVEQVQFYGHPLNCIVWSHVVFQEKDGTNRETFKGDFTIFNEAGQVVMKIVGLLVKRAPREALLRLGQQQPWSDWLYNVNWQPQVPSKPTALTTRQGHWLIFADSIGIGLTLANLLEESGERCILVFPEAVYRMQKQGCWSVDPARREDFERLIWEDLEGLSILGVVHLWSLDDLSFAQTSVTSVRDKVTSCASVLHLVQSLAQQAVGHELPKLWLVTLGAQAVGYESSLGVSIGSALWGLGRVIALEHPQLWGGLVDLDPESSEMTNVLLLCAVLRQPKGEDQIAFRQGQHYVPRLESRSTPTPAQGSVVPLSLPAEGTYLITGGLGSLGLKVANWLVTQGARHLVLVNRSRPSDSAQALLYSLEQIGAQIIVVQADVSEEQQVAGVLAQISTLLPPLKGVIHAAGILEDGMLLKQEWANFARVLAPKVTGAWNLHRLTQDMTLDFFVLFSSISALLGTPGQGNYAAANAFLDALAHYRRSKGLPALSINWGPWAEVGMAASLEERERQRLSTQGIGTIVTKQGLEILGLLLQQPQAQVSVLVVKWSKLLQQFPIGGEPSLLSKIARKEQPRVKTTAPALQRSELRLQLVEASFEQSQNLITAYLHKQVVRVLQLDPTKSIDMLLPLNELGFDSLMTTELKNRLEDELGIPVPLVLLLQNPSILELAAKLVEALPEKLSPLTATPSSTTYTNVQQPADQWILKTKPNPEACLRLFCFHYLGGGASVFRKWSEDLPLDIEVCCVQLPGRESRIIDKPFDQFAPLVEMLTQVLHPYLDKPYAFYGHSMGALVSFEVARQLRRQYNLNPVHLFTAAYYAPHLLSPFQTMIDEEWTDAKWIDSLPTLLSAPKSLLENPELMQAILPLVQADARVLASYNYVTDVPFSCPITTFGGLQDESVQEDSLTAWRKHTNGSFKLQMFPGNHLFLESDKDLLLHFLSQELKPLLEQIQRQEH